MTKKMQNEKINEQITRTVCGVDLNKNGWIYEHVVRNLDGPLDSSILPH